MLTCAHCEYSTNRTYNLNRHIKTHQNSNNNNINTTNKIDINIPILEPKSGKMEPKSGKMEPKSGKVEPKSGKVEPKSGKHECSSCYKLFCYHKTMLRHQLKCKKINNPCECPNCHDVFDNKQQLYDHKRRDNCTSTSLVTLEELSTDIDIQKERPLVNNSYANIETQNNVGQLIQNNSIQNNDNSQNITINVFPTSLHSDYSINTDHINFDELRQNLRHQSIFEAVGTSLRKVLQNVENLPVKKKNIKSNYSYVHVGNNQWEMRKDKEVFGLISFHISRCIQVYLEGKNLHQLHTYYREATEALEFVATDNMEDLEREYIKKAKRIMDVIMLSAYERTDVDLGSLLQKVKTNG